jgi:hypothetical protein
MNVARSLVGTVLVVFSSAALAHVLAPAASGSGGASTAAGGESHAAAAAPAHADTRVGSGGARVASSLIAESGALKGATVTQISIAGELATVVMFAPHPPLTAAEREKIRKAGYIRFVQQGSTFFCQRAPMGSQGWVHDCFGFASLSDVPKSGSSAKDGKGSGSQKSVTPDTIGAPPSRAMVAVFSPAS